MFNHIDHIGLAVEAAEPAIARYEALGLRVTHDERVTAQGTRAIFLSAPSGPDLELLVPLGPDTPVGKFLAKRGPGMHHICYAVADLDGALDDCRALGLQLIDETPRIGAKGKRLAFIHPKAMDGTLIELYESAAVTKDP